MEVTVAGYLDLILWDLEKQYKCSLCCHSELQAQPKDDSAKLKDVAYAVHNADIYIFN
jgi:hypothetical protein